jgi:hypothetical protein
MKGQYLLPLLGLLTITSPSKADVQTYLDSCKTAAQEWYLHGGGKEGYAQQNKLHPSGEYPGPRPDIQKLFPVTPFNPESMQTVYPKIDIGEIKANAPENYQAPEKLLERLNREEMTRRASELFKAEKTYKR